MTCIHNNTMASTLVTECRYATSETPYEVWRCRCVSCGKVTEPCLTEHEAQLRGMVGMWDEPVTCSACRFSHVETRKGERVLYCYERGYGLPTDKDATCPKGIRRDA